MFGSGKFGPPSITVHAADATGNVAPVRHIVGPKTQLNWPTGISVDSARGEIYVSNAAGDSINVYSATASGDVAPIRQIKGPKTLLRNPNGVSVDTVNGEVWVANFGNHTATAYKWDANGNADPVRVIRSAPLNAPTTLISNPYMIAFDGAARRGAGAELRGPAADRGLLDVGRQERRAEADHRRAEHAPEPHRARDRLRRDPRRDRRAVEHGPGGGDLPRRRKWRRGADPDHPGPKTLLRDPESLFIDPVHNEIFVFNMGTDDTMLVYDRMAQGDVAPKRVLKTPAAIGGVGAADPVSNLIFLSGRNNGILVFDRTAEGTTPPLRTIGGGPISGLRSPGRIVVHPPTRSLIVTSSAGRATRDPVTRNLVPHAYVGVWSQDDNGDVAPRWTVAKGFLYMPRGLTLDPKKKTVIVSDKYMNSVMTFSLPELYDRPAARRHGPRGRTTLRSESRPDHASPLHFRTVPLLKGTVMHARRAGPPDSWLSSRSIVGRHGLYVLTREPVRGVDLHSRLRVVRADAPRDDGKLHVGCGRPRARGASGAARRRGGRPAPGDGRSTRSRRACRSRRFAIRMPASPPSASTRCTTKSS